ncbi:MAG: hypothetical protein ACON4U_07480 [Myxococcota bacterium]
METCPYCSSPIPSTYLIEGGICDNCGQLILGEEDLIEDEPTNMLLQDDLPTDETTMGGHIRRLQRPKKPMYELQMDEDFGVQIDRLTQSLPAHAMGETRDSVEQQKDNTVNIAVPGKRRNERGGKGPLILGGGILFSMLALGWFAHQNPNQEFRRFTGISIFFPDQDRHVDAMTIEEKKEKSTKSRRRRRRTNQSNTALADNGSNGATSSGSASNGPIAPTSVDDLSALLMPSVSANTIGTDSIGGSAANTDDQVSREFQMKLGQFKICHARASKTYGNIRGRWKIKVNVNADGSISNFSVRPERDSNEMLESCIQEKGERWSFTAPGSTVPLETTLIYN